MQLEGININRPTYGENQGRLVGTVKFSGDSGKITVNLDEATSEAIIRLCADGIVRAANELSTNLVAETLIASSNEEELALPDPGNHSDGIYDNEVPF